MPYTGRDGLTHQETVIDWDKTLNTKVSAHVPMPKEELEALRGWLRDRYKQNFDRFVAVNPALAGIELERYVIRDQEKMQLRWDMELLQGIFDAGDPYGTNFFFQWITLLEKRQEAFNNNDLSLKTPQVKG